MDVTHIAAKLLFVLLLTVALCDAKSRTSKTRRGPHKSNLSGKCRPHILAEYDLSFHGGWSASLYPRMYPRYRPRAQWSKLIGRSHSETYDMWTLGSLASNAVKDFAENSDTRGFDKEAQAYGGIFDSFTAAPIRGGMGKSATHFIADGRHAKVSFMVKLMPSPDWFVGVASLDLCERKRWRKKIDVDLYPLDAGTDKGFAFTSPDWPSVPQQVIYQLSPTVPSHDASAFHYTNRTSLPPIAKIQLNKVSEYRRKGKKLPPLVQERNLVILSDDDMHAADRDVIPIIQKLVQEAAMQAKVQTMDTRQNEIASASISSDDDGCIVSEWSAWTACSKTCGFGRQERRRSIVRRATSKLGRYCPVLREDKTCGSMRICERKAFSFLSDLTSNGGTVHPRV